MRDRCVLVAPSVTAAGKVNEKIAVGAELPPLLARVAEVVDPEIVHVTPPIPEPIWLEAGTDELKCVARIGRECVFDRVEIAFACIF